LASITDGSNVAGGVAVGEAAAAQLNAADEGHPLGGTFQFTQSTAVGKWRAVASGSDPNAWVKDVHTFLIEDGTQFATDGPNALTSAAYTEEFIEVKAYGGLTGSLRSLDQTDMARFWADNAFGLWSRILRNLANAEGLSTAENARLFAMAYLSAADAQITVWNDKELYGLWRPITAIRDAELDGNPDTLDDDTWTPLIGTPPYPEHPSGASAVASAMGYTLQRFFGTDKMEFGTFSNFSGTTRTFTRFSEAVKEVVDARIYSGIHFRTADTQSRVIGKQVFHWMIKHAFRPID
jgi:hypothetical protein